VGCERVDRGSQLDIRLDVGLQPEAGRALPPVAEAYRERVAGAQVTAADADQQRVGIGPDVEPVEPDFEPGAVARLHGSEVRGMALVELRLTHVRGGPP